MYNGRVFAGNLMVDSYVSLMHSVFQEKDAFIGYREDTPASVVFQANRQLQRLVQNKDRQSPEWKRFEQAGVFDKELVSALVNSDGNDESEYWILAVSIIIILFLLIKLVLVNNILLMDCPSPNEPLEIKRFW